MRAMSILPWPRQRRRSRIGRETPAAERSRILLRIADLIERDLEKLARAESIDTGKPLSLARTLDIPRAASNFRFFATAILHTESEAHITDNVAFNYTLRQPRGIAGLISPWNLPLYLLSWKIAPAIAVGNTAIAKAERADADDRVSAVRNLSRSRIAERRAQRRPRHRTECRRRDHGASEDRHDLVYRWHGDRTQSSGSVRTVVQESFTRARRKNPNIVFADADLDAAIAGSVRSSFANQGQVCLCGSRVFVERSAYKDFVDRFIDKSVEAKSRRSVGRENGSGRDREQSAAR